MYAGNNYDEIDKYKIWSKNYRFNLELLLNDLELIISNNYDIIIAVDFHDIFQYCFPFAKILRSGGGSLWVDEKSKNFYIKQQLSRAIVFFMLKSIYNKPLLLLPPYLRESNDFFKRLSTQAGKYSNLALKKEIISNLSQEFYDEFKKEKSDNINIKLVNVLYSKAPEIAFLFSRSFKTGMEAYTSLLAEYISPDPKKIVPQGSDQNDNFIKTYLPKISLICKKNNKIYEKAVRDVRDYPDKYLQNKRDAEAIRETYELNNMFNRDQMAFFFVSSAPHMQRLQDNQKYYKKVQGKDFNLIRDLDFFLIIFNEISNLSERIGRKIDINELDPRMLREQVILDLTLLSNFLDESFMATLGGVVKESMEKEIAKQIRVLNNHISNIDLALNIQNFIPKNQNVMNLKDFIKGNEDLAKNEIIDALASIVDAIETDDFAKKIFERDIQLEMQRMNHFWALGIGKLPYIKGRKKQSVSLLNLPFRICLKDEKASSILEEFMISNKNAKNQLKYKKSIPKQILDQIYKELQNLSSLAYRLETEEKYVLWQIIFLCFSRDQLINDWNSHFMNWVQQETGRELLYIYLISRIRQLRGNYSAGIDDYNNYLNECAKYDFVLLEEISIEHKSIFNNEQLIYSEFEKRGIHLAENVKIFESNNATYFAQPPNGSKCKDIYVLVKASDNIKLYSCDIRFVYLKSVILSECSKTYKIDDIIDIHIKNLEQFLLPLTENFEKEYDLTIKAYYAYLLARVGGDNNILTANSLIESLKKDFSNTVYWGFTKDYILGFIKFIITKSKICGHDFEFLEESSNILYKALDSLPDEYINMRREINSLLGALEQIKNEELHGSLY